MILLYKIHQSVFFVCVYEDSVLHTFLCRFQISRSRPFMGKKVKLEKNKIVPSVLYIHASQYSVICCHRNTILHFFKLTLLFKVKSVWPLITMHAYKRLKPVTADYKRYQ